MNCSLCQSTEFHEYISGGDYLHCASCDLVWLKPSLLLSPAEELERYHLHQNSVESADYLKFLSKLANPMRNYIQPGWQGIDFGAGTEQGMAALFPDCSIAAYDPFFHPDRDLLNNSYDFILCSEAAEHFYQPKKEFELFQRMLRERGILGISSALRPAKEKFMGWHYRRDPSHVSFFSEITVQWLANFYGWKLLEMNSPIWIFQKG